MTIDQRSKQSAVDIARDGDVIRLRQEVTDRFVAIPVAFDLMSMFVESPTSITVGKHIRVVILERFLTHEYDILLANALNQGVLVGSGVNVGRGVLVAVGVRVTVAVLVGETVREGVGVREGVNVGIAVGASPSTMNCPICFHSNPTKICTSYVPGSHSEAGASHSVKPNPPVSPFHGMVS